MQLLADSDTVPLNDTDFAKVAVSALTGTGIGFDADTTKVASDGGRSSPVLSPKDPPTSTTTRARGISFAPTAAVMRTPLNAESAPFVRARGMSTVHGPPIGGAAAASTGSDVVDVSLASRPLKSALKNTTGHRRASSLRFEDDTPAEDVSRSDDVQGQPLVLAPLRTETLLRDLPHDDPSLSIRELLRRGVSRMDDEDSDDNDEEGARGPQPPDLRSQDICVQIHQSSAADPSNPTAYSQFD